MPENAASSAPASSRWVHLLAALLGALPIYGLALYNGWQSYIHGFEMPHVVGSLYNVAINLVVFGGLLLVLLHMISRQTVRSLTLKPGGIGGDLLDGFGLAGMLLTAQLVFNILVARSPELPAANQAIAEALSADPWLLLVWAGPVIWLQAALLEEFTRTFVLSRVWQVWTSDDAKLIVLIVSAVLFGLGHVYQGWGGVAATTIIGFILGYYYLRRGRVLPMILAHGVYNTIVLGFMVYSVRSGLFSG